MFEGEHGGFLPISNERALTEKWFYALGKAIVVSLVTGGPRFPYFTESCFSYLIDNQKSETTQFQHELSGQVQLLIDKVKQSAGETDVRSITNQEQFNSLMQQINSNCKDIIKITDKILFVQTVTKWFLVDKRKTAMEQLKEGLNTFNFLDRTKLCPGLKSCLVRDTNFTPNEELITSRLLPKLGELSTRNEKEVEIKHFAATLLLALKGDQAADLFEFMTGMRELPLDKDIELHIAFNQQSPDDTLPRAVTCGHLLLLPLGNADIKSFHRSFKLALEHRDYFGRI